MADDKERSSNGAPRSLWSGTLSFGLVTIPVALFPAVRSSRPTLRMMDEDGTPLRRRWCCPRERRIVERDELVRGYPVGEDEYVIVTDEELEALAPRKSRDIDLRRFVPRSELAPRYFERGYFLAPTAGAEKAYRLLAEVMERTERAGIATFVMREKEYLVAILADRGILAAETMRFADELRPATAAGLPSKPPSVKRELVRRFERAISDRGAEFDPAELDDDTAARLRTLAERKHARGKDVVEAPEVAEETGGAAEIVDLMEVLKRSLGVEERRRPAARRAASRQRGERLSELSRDELYRRARELDIRGRSSMSKDELIEALRSVA